MKRFSVTTISLQDMPQDKQHICIHSTKRFIDLVYLGTFFAILVSFIKNEKTIAKYIERGKDL